MNTVPSTLYAVINLANAFFTPCTTQQERPEAISSNLTRTALRLTLFYFRVTSTFYKNLEHWNPDHPTGHHATLLLSMTSC